jgi:hypothetical protein
MTTSISLHTYTYIYIYIYIYIFTYVYIHIHIRARGLFDDHINISPEDKTLAIERILLAQADFILFADTSYDSRVFALAHER